MRFPFSVERFREILLLWATGAYICGAITLRTFSLVTNTGENVLHANFDRRRLADRSIDRLALKFHALEKQFEFEFARSHPMFAPGATIKMTGSVSEHTTTLCSRQAPIITTCTIVNRNCALPRYITLSRSHEIHVYATTSA